MAAIGAFYFQGIAMPSIVADGVQSLAAHGLRRIDQTIFALADMIAAKARNTMGS
jgi:hypothetical protein